MPTLDGVVCPRRVVHRLTVDVPQCWWEEGRNAGTTSTQRAGSTDVVGLQCGRHHEHPVVHLFDHLVEDILQVGRGDEGEGHEALHVSAHGVRLLVGVEVQLLQAVARNMAP